MARILGEFFSIDLRSLAVFRVGLAFSILYDVADRSRDLVAHYTDLGALPAATVLKVWGAGVYASPFYWASGSPLLVGLLFLALALSALALGLGWRTRLAAGVCWFLLVTLQIRNPPSAAMGGDKYLRILLFWSLFLPLGARMSMDALRSRPASPRSDRLLCVPGAVLLLQVCVMYWTTGLLKNGETWKDGTAVLYALNLDMFATSFGVWLRDQTWVHPVLTHGTRWLEILGPCLAFSPVATGPLRCLTILVFASFHLGLAAGLTIGAFPLVSMISWLAFLPPWFWDEALPKIWAGLSRRLPRMEGAAWPVPKWSQAVSGTLFAYVVLMLLARGADVATPGPLRQFGQALRISQTWSMFAPDPTDGEAWPVFRGLQNDGTLVDPLRGEPPFTEKPTLVSRTFPSFRWRLFFTYLKVDTTDPNFELLFSGLSRYLCRSWNLEHDGPQALREVEIEYWVEDNRDFEAPIEKYRIHRKRCAEPSRTA